MYSYCTRTGSLDLRSVQIFWVNKYFAVCQLDHLTSIQFKLWVKELASVDMLSVLLIWSALYRLISRVQSQFLKLSRFFNESIVASLIDNWKYWSDKTFPSANTFVIIILLIKIKLSTQLLVQITYLRTTSFIKNATIWNINTLGRDPI